MARKRRTTATRKRTTAKSPTRRRKTRSTKKSTSGIVNFFVPMFFIFCILFCLGFLSFMGYRTAAASSFFDIERVELQGVRNLPKDKLESIAKTHSIKSGVWNADLDAIKSEVKRFRYAKQVSVSRVLPDSIKIIVDERKPVAIVRLNGKDYWADDEAIVLNRVSVDDKRLPFLMTGWDESDSERAQGDNQKRVALYRELQQEWEEYDLAERVVAVDLTDLRDPRALVVDSGRNVTISLGRDEYRKRLKKALEVVAGKGNRIESVITSGVNPIIGYRDS